MYLGLQIIPTSDTRRRDPSDWENSPPTSDPTPEVKTLIRLFFLEQFDLGLHCLFKPKGHYSMYSNLL